MGQLLLLTDDRGMGDLVRAQVENLGNRCEIASEVTPDGAALDRSSGVIVDLAAGSTLLRQVRKARPELPVLAIAPDEAAATRARRAGATAVLVEPFSVVDLVDAVRTTCAPPASGPAAVVDLRSGAPVETEVVEDAPWWATR